MKPFFSRSLRMHLLLLVAVAVVPALALLLYTGQELRHAAIDGAQERALRLAQDLARLQTRVVDNTRVLLITLAQAPEVQRLDKAAIEAFFKILLTKHSAYGNFGVAAADGTVIAAAVPVTPPTIGDRKYFQAAIARGDFSIGEYTISRATKAPSLHFGYPVTDAGGNLRGVLYATFHLSSYGKIFTEAQFPPQSSLELLDHRGICLYRYPHPERYVGQQDTPECLSHLTPGKDEGTYVTKGDDGIVRLYSYQRLRLKEDPGSFLLIQVGIPEAEALAEARAINRRNLLLMGLTTVLALGLAWLLGNFLVMGRVKRLVAASRRLGRGDLSARTGLAHDEGELGQLAQAVDDMAGALEEREAQRQEALTALQRSQEELTIRTRIADTFLSTADNQVFDQVLGIVLEATGSPYGVFGYLNDQGDLVCPSMSREIWEACQVAGKDIVFPHHAWGDSLWTKALRDKQPYVANQPLQPPPGHIAISRAVSVPILCQDNVLGILTVANKATDYEESDQKLMTSCAGYIGPILQARLSREREEGERRRAERALAVEKERLQVTLRSIGDGVIATDTGGRIVLMNNVAENLTGWQQEEALGRPLEEVFVIIHEKTRQPCENPVPRVLSTAKVVGLANHTLLIARDGTERVLADSGAPIIDADNRIIGVVLVFQDITAKRRMEEEFYRMEKLRSLGVLAGGIAHDFNNILTGILGGISLARMALPEELEAAQRLREAEQAAGRARDLVSQLLTFAKGGAPITETINMAKIIRESAQFACSGSAVQCDFDLGAELWAVRGDPGQLSQVVQNLVLNAVQAMPEGGVIRIRGKNAAVGEGAALPLKAGLYVRISLQDHGMGILPEHQPHVYDPFFTTKPGGSGLGLATVYSIIRNHDGCIILDSEPEQGTTFTFYLPASTGRVEDGKDIEAMHPGDGRILVMDDDELIREVLGHMLSKLGYEGSFARDGAEALARYQEAQAQGQPFAAVIMDLTIPGGMGGKEAIARLLDIDPRAKAIVSSGYSDDPIMSNYRAFGFAGVIAKPYKITDLSVALEKALTT